MTRFEWVCWVVERMPSHNILAKLPYDYHYSNFYQSPERPISKNNYEANNLIIKSELLAGEYRTLAGSLNLHLAIEAAILLKKESIFTCWVESGDYADPIKRFNNAKHVIDLLNLEHCSACFQIKYFDFLILDIHQYCEHI